MHEPHPAGKAIAFDQPWEGNVSAYITIFRDGDKVRMYYRGASDPAYSSGAGHVPKHSEVTCYAESPDGLVWSKPKLGLYEFNGSKANNIVWTGPGTRELRTVQGCQPSSASSAALQGAGRIQGIDRLPIRGWNPLDEDTRGACDY